MQSSQPQSTINSAPSKKPSQQQLGPLLCWAVVFADIGTSVYYVPGILYGTVGPLAGFFVLLTMLVFILLTFKYVEVTYRFPQGGGVVTVAARALNNWFGALGGMFILVDYFLTAAISGLSGMLYLSVVLPGIGPQSSFLGLNITVWITITILVLLGLLNCVGVQASAQVSLVGAFIAFVSDIAIFFSVFTHISFSEFIALFPAMFHARALTPISLLIGFAGSFLAFSGLESISQLAPEMKLPRRMVGKMALFLVVLTVGLTSPLLTLLSTLLLPDAAANPVLSSQLISLLAGKWGGPLLRTEVAISASALLVFASNTAIIGSYHVFMALSRMEFFPRLLLQRNKLRDTPQYAIGLATLIPIAVLIAVRGDVNILGDMYAFGLLGAFTLTCLGMDIVRYRQRKARKHPPSEAQETSSQSSATPDQIPEPEGRWTLSTFNFILGIITTVLVLVAWLTNLLTKPLATAFGGSVAILGMAIAFFSYRYHQRRGRVPVITTDKEHPLPSAILAVLTADSVSNSAVMHAAIHNVEKKPVVFLYIGKRNPEQKHEFFRLHEPHLNDEQASKDFGQANYLAQQAGVVAHFIYHPQKPGVAYRAWQTTHPFDTIVAPDKVDLLQPFQPVRSYEEATTEGKVVHLLTA